MRVQGTGLCELVGLILCVGLFLNCHWVQKVGAHYRLPVECECFVRTKMLDPTGLNGCLAFKTRFSGIE